MATDAEWYRYVNQLEDGDLCISCREEVADPDDLDGLCNWCQAELDDEEC